MQVPLILPLFERYLSTAPRPVLVCPMRLYISLLGASSSEDESPSKRCPPKGECIGLDIARLSHAQEPRVCSRKLASCPLDSTLYSAFYCAVPLQNHLSPAKTTQKSEMAGFPRLWATKSMLDASWVFNAARLTVVTVQLGALQAALDSGLWKRILWILRAPPEKRAFSK